VGAVAFYSVISMYIMDHVKRDQIGRTEPQRLLFIGLAWTVGPIAGIQAEAVWGPWAPFLVSIAAASLLLCYFLVLRFSNAPVIGAAANRTRLLSWSQVRAFSAQPRLVLSWFHAAGRGFYWGAFNIYAPLFAVQSGLGAQAGGLLVSVGSAFMLAMPLWGWLSRRFGIRRVSLVCFPVAGVGMAAGGFLSASPWTTVGFLILSALAMSIIDGYGNSLFLRACKPSQRTELAPIFSTHRDITDVGQAAMFAVLLTFLPVQIVFVFTAVVLSALTLLALRINSRL